MNRRFFIFLIISLALAPCFAQQSLKPFKTIESKAKKVKIDVLNNIYLITDNKVEKYSFSHKTTVNYNFQIPDSEMIVDVSNPFKILIFSPNNYSLKYINNQMTESAKTIYLDKFTSDNIPLACTSYNNCFWLFNASEKRIERYNMSLTKTHQSSPIYLLSNEDFSPKHMAEYNEKLYLFIPNNGVLIFDKFAAFVKKIPIIFEKKSSFINNQFFYIKGNSIMIYNTKTFEDFQLIEMENEIADFDINQKFLAILQTDGKLTIYEIAD